MICHILNCCCHGVMANANGAAVVDHQVSRFCMQISLLLNYFPAAGFAGRVDIDPLPTVH